MPRPFIPGHHEPETPSNTVAYFMREALRRIWVSKRTSFVAVAMIAMSLFILGSFLLIADNLAGAITRWQGKSRVNVYLDDEVTPDQIKGVDAYLASDADLRKRTFITREQALARFKSHFSSLTEVVEQLDSNPFPPSFEIEVAPRIAQSRGFDQRMTRLRALPGVEQVQYDWEWVNQLKRLVNIINTVGVIAGGILAVAAAFTIANVIRLTMLTYREEIEIMRLVGATERIIRGPFLIEGIVQGIIGGLVAVALLFGAFHIARDTVAAKNSFVWSFLLVTFLPWQKIAALVLGGMAAGWLGSWLSVREHAQS